ncbi:MULTISPECIES: MurR/RpiR family transcriptional regulator [Aliivibrio]|uniref:MurR/RpiR family transcriptional regulator n=1 Tax=Aliivibrio TaxID=511678 RepID=UPI00031976CA|nr:MULTISPECIES: MurR/RpiR family transcriptional regulator [Aliivibrio]MBD1568682.1 MurR/RpiR family transcriptional regulator [Aliivibrio sp. S10_S31]MUH97804.1 MurR/RpiR family transcriptional regulator [Aliivibrio fischeri]MUI63253.1 MurR/RpiR family transcriptional regulator [Aliivibrio fischeri]OCH04751.1 transcriptional regulator [Aliivibrio fischeri]OCH06764.1 transcriptional regulator [Aliivibrio fischeri]
MNTFRGIERTIYEYLIGHASDLQNIPAKTIANKALTTTTSVNRVCKKMGYASYTELRYKLSNELNKESNSQQNEGNEQQQIAELANTLKSSPVVYLYSRGASIVSITYLSRFLSLANVPHLVITDIHQLTRAELGTLLLVSKSGETTAVIDMAYNAKRKGLKVLGISHKGSTLEQACHLNIILEEQVDGVSLYGRESQIHILQIIDQIGKELLTF